MQTQSPPRFYVSDCKGADSCCTPYNKCDVDEGDCDSKDDCKPGLLCGSDNCQIKTGLQWDTADDCCYKPRMTIQVVSGD